MRQGKGFTFIELIIALTITSIILVGAVPSFSRWVEHQRITTAGNDFFNTLMYTRGQASYSSKRAVLTYRGENWRSGWLVYLDKNNNGLQDSDEPTLNEHGPLDPKIRIYTGRTVKNYIGYNALGNSVHANNSFFADSVTFCPASIGGAGVRIKVSIGGRARLETIDANAAPCNS